MKVANLNENEKELLPVIRYYNTKRADKSVARLVRKLTQNLDMESAASLTGFSVREVDELISSLPKRKSKPPIEKVEPIEPTFNEATTADRVAGDLARSWADGWKAEFKSGDKFLSSKHLMERYQISKADATLVFDLLQREGFIEQAEPGNFRKGYVVK
jgi:hypothetical protein